MIYRYPEMEAVYHGAPVPLQVVFRELESIVFQHGIEPILYKLGKGCSGPLDEELRRLEIQCGPFLYSPKIIEEVLQKLAAKYGPELIVIHRKKFGSVPERIILEIPAPWAEYPKVFLARFGYIKGGYHA